MKMEPVFPVTLAVVMLIMILAYILWTVREKGLKIRLAVMSGLLFVMNLNPVVPVRNVRTFTRSLDVLFVLDATLSMWAYDDGVSRNDLVGDLCTAFVEDLEGASFAVVRFDNRAQILCPFTEDRDNVLDAVWTLAQPLTGYARGSAMNTPMASIAELLADTPQDRAAVLIFISDGENTSDQPLSSYEEIASYVDAGAIIGIGSDHGEMFDSRGHRLIDTETGEDALSVMDEDSLRRIADDLRLPYQYVSHSRQVRALADQILDVSFDSVKSRKAESTSGILHLLVPVWLLSALDLLFWLRKKRRL